MYSLLAQARISSWGFGEMAIAVVVIAAICALVFVACRQFGITIPAWIMHVAWIVIAAVVIIWAIRFLLAQ